MLIPGDISEVSTVRKLSNLSMLRCFLHAFLPIFMFQKKTIREYKYFQKG
jgi:hypothetical protein